MKWEISEDKEINIPKHFKFMQTISGYIYEAWIDENTDIYRMIRNERFICNCKIESMRNNIDSGEFKITEVIK